MQETKPTRPESAIAALDTQVWTTKGARFNASRRLILNHYWSTSAVAALSVYSVVAGMFLLVANGPAREAAVLSATLVGASIGILTLSLLESARSYQLRSDRHHRCGMQLNELYSTIRYANIRKDESIVPQVTADYHRLLQCYEENHSPADYNMFLAQHPSDFKLNGWRAGAMKLGWYWRAAGPYLFAIAVPPVLFLLLS